MDNHSLPVRPWPDLLKDLELHRTPRNEWSSIPFYRDLTAARTVQDACEASRFPKILPRTLGERPPALPLEVLFEIVDYCDKRTLLNLRCVCKTLKRAVQLNPFPSTTLHLRPWRSLYVWDDITKLIYGPARIPGFNIRVSESMEPAITYEITFLDAYDLPLFASTMSLVAHMWPVQPPRTEVAIRFGGSRKPNLCIPTGVKCYHLIYYAVNIARHCWWKDQEVERTGREWLGDGHRWIRFRFSLDIGEVVVPPPIRKIHQA